MWTPDKKSAALAAGLAAFNALEAGASGKEKELKPKEKEVVINDTKAPELPNFDFNPNSGDPELEKRILAGLVKEYDRLTEILKTNPVDIKTIEDRDDLLKLNPQLVAVLAQRTQRGKEHGDQSERAADSAKSPFKYRSTPTTPAQKEVLEILHKDDDKDGK